MTTTKSTTTHLYRLYPSAVCLFSFSWDLELGEFFSAFIFLVSFVSLGLFVCVCFPDPPEVKIECWPRSKQKKLLFPTSTKLRMTVERRRSSPVSASRTCSGTAAPLGMPGSTVLPIKLLKCC